MSISGNPIRQSLSLCAFSSLSPRERVRVRGPFPTLPQHWLLALCLLCCLCLLSYPSAAQTWQEKTSTHFRVFYQQNSAFAAAVLEYAEAYYSQIRLDLGL